MPESQAESQDNYSNRGLALWKGSTNGLECLNHIPIGARSIVTCELDIVTGRLTGYVLSYRTTVEDLHARSKFNGLTLHVLPTAVAFSNIYHTQYHLSLPKRKRK